MRTGIHMRTARLGAASLLAALLLWTAASLPLGLTGAAAAQEEEATPAVLAAPELTAAPGENAVDLSWTEVSGAVRYELYVWWAGAAGWQRLGGDGLSGRTFRHMEVTVGTNYYYTVLAVNAAGEKSAWPGQEDGYHHASAAVSETGAPKPTVSSPPPSLGLDPYYQKYVDAGGVPVVSSPEVPDEELLEARDVILALLSNRPDLLKTMSENGFYVDMYPSDPPIGQFFLKDAHQLPGYPPPDPDEIIRGYGGKRASAPDSGHEYCGYVLLHEFLHAVDAALQLQPGGHEFSSRLENAYQAAVSADLWPWQYARLNAAEYWAETGIRWLFPRIFVAPSLRTVIDELADYDPVFAELAEDVFGDVTMPAACESVLTFDMQGTITGPDGGPFSGAFVQPMLWTRGRGPYRLVVDTVTGADGTFSLALEEEMDSSLLSFAGDGAPYITLNLGDVRENPDDYWNRPGPVECITAGHLGQDGTVTKSKDPNQWKRIEVTGNDISRISIRIPENFDWTPIYCP